MLHTHPSSSHSRSHPTTPTFVRPHIASIVAAPTTAIMLVISLVARVGLLSATVVCESIISVTAATIVPVL